MSVDGILVGFKVGDSEATVAGAEAADKTACKSVLCDCLTNGD